MSRGHVLAGLAVFVLALVPRLLYVEQNERELGLDVSRLDQTDNHVFDAWARIIAAGDLLCWKQPHAYHHWTAEVAPEGRWVEWYGGEATYHQAPLYPYAVAAVFSLLGAETQMVARAQAVLGALTCLLTFLLARSVLSLRAAVIAGLLLAFMGPFYFYDAFVLRDGPMAFLVALSALLLQRAATVDHPWRWFLAGASLGLFALAKETGPGLLVLTIVALVAWQRRRPRAALLRVGVLVLGYLLLLSPAVARNVVVGAPAFKLSTRGPEVFVSGNALGQTGVGWEPPVDELRRILVDSNYSLPGTVWRTLATHRADPLGWLAILWNKTAAYFNGYEVPNNVDFYLHRAHLPTLRLGFVSMAFLGPACLLGLVVCLGRWRRMAVLYLMFGAITASVVALYILARFRLQALPLMAVFAAAAVEWALVAWSTRRRLALGSGGLLFALLAHWCWWDEDPFGDRNKHTGIMMPLAKIGEFEKAMRFRDLLLAAVRPEGDRDPAPDPLFTAKLDTLTAAFAAFERGAALAEDDPRRHLHLGQGYSLLQLITKRGDLRDLHGLALRHYRRAGELDPDLPGVEHGIGQTLWRHAEQVSADLVAPDLGPALSHFLRELRRHPDHGESHRDAGSILFAWEEHARALPHLLAAERHGLADAVVLAAVARISVDPRLREAPAVQVGGEVLPVFDPPRGWEYGRRALHAAPRDPLVLYNVADVLSTERRHDEAVALLEQLMELEPWRQADLANRIAKFREMQANQRAREAAAVAPVQEGAVIPATGGAGGGS